MKEEEEEKDERKSRPKRPKAQPVSRLSSQPTLTRPSPRGQEQTGQPFGKALQLLLPLPSTSVMGTGCMYLSSAPTPASACVQ